MEDGEIPQKTVLTKNLEISQQKNLEINPLEIIIETGLEASQEIIKIGITPETGEILVEIKGEITLEMETTVTVLEIMLEITIPETVIITVPETGMITVLGTVMIEKIPEIEMIEIGPGTVIIKTVHETEEIIQNLEEEITLGAEITITNRDHLPTGDQILITIAKEEALEITEITNGDLNLLDKEKTKEITEQRAETAL